MFQQILHPLFWLLSHSCQVVITFSFTVSFQHFPVDFARFPLIVIMFSCSFYILFVGFQSIHAFLIYFSKIFTRLLFAPFPLVCCIFNVFFQEFYPSPSFSDRFCTISSGCYRIFLHFHCLFPTCLLHRHSLFLAVTPVSSTFQQILHGLFLAFAPFSSVFQGVLYDFLWSLSCFPAASLYFPIHPHGLPGHQKGGPRGNRYPTVSKLPSGT